MTYQVKVAKSAAKTIHQIPNPDRGRIATAISDLRDNPRPHGYTHLSGEDRLYRIRVGNYRVIYSIDDGQLTIYVVRVGHRREVYRAM